MDYLRRRLIQFLGLLVLAAGAAVIAALISFDPSDRSINTVSDDDVENLLGPAGAMMADLLIQSLGVASAVVVAAFATWGGRLTALAAPPPHPRLRFLVLLFSLPFAAIAVAPMGDTGGIALPAGPGGVMGRLILDQLTLLIPIPAWILPLAGAVVAGLLILFALGLSFEEWRKVGRGIARFGRGVVKIVSWFGRLLPKTTDFHADAKATHHEEPASVAPAAAPGRKWHLPGLGKGKAEPDAAASGDIAEARAANSPLAGDEDEAVAGDRLPLVDLPPAVRPAPRPVSGGAASAQETVRDLVAPKAPKVPPGKREQLGRQGALDLGIDSNYRLPPLDLLSLPPADGRAGRIDEESLAQNARLLENVLDDFGVNGEVVKVRPGPVVTLYELEPAPGTKTSRVIGLADDIARSMSALSVRIATVPGRSVIGIELPNARRETVYLRELLASDAFERAPARLTLVLGKDIGGGPVMVDLSRMPHLLIAGTTGSGKSVAINTMILSLLFRLPPEECRMIMIDPKMLELSVYDGIPHLLAPVVTDPHKAVVALKWAVREMEDRYRAMSQLGVRNIAGYNQRLAEARDKGEKLSRTVQTGFDSETGKPIYEDQDLNLEALPFIVVVVDEMADLMLVAGKDIEGAVQRLAQMARAAGIHLIMATQRPSVDVITGTIKANFPTRISFQVTSKIDSRTILGEQGAEQLLGQGDMLYMAAGGRISRVHGPFVSDHEVELAVEHLRNQGEPQYVESVTEEEEAPAAMGGDSGGSGEDALYDQAVALVAREGKASTSFVQRHLQIGYNRAARLIERMESEGVVSRANHVGKREVLVRSHES